jgi:uncharacterized protein (DUF433 family)
MNCAMGRQVTHRFLSAVSCEPAMTWFRSCSQPSTLLEYNAVRGIHMSLVIEEQEIDSLPITIDPEVVSGAPVFRGTRVPVDALLSNLEAGLSLDEFLENFPTVSREQALQVLGFSRSTLQRLAQPK